MNKYLIIQKYSEGRARLCGKIRCGGKAKISAGRRIRARGDIRADTSRAKPRRFIPSEEAQRGKHKQTLKMILHYVRIFGCLYDIHMQLTRGIL